MLALVKKPHIELSMTGEHLEELLAWIRKKFDIAVLAEAPDDELVSIESTGFWKEMERNRVGNLLAGARLKAGLTQAQLAEKLGIRQNMVSDYERGRRAYSDAMANRLSKVLQVREEHLRYGNEPPPAANAARKPAGPSRCAEGKKTGTTGLQVKPSVDAVVREIRELGAPYRAKAKNMLADLERMRAEDDRGCLLRRRRGNRTA